MLLTSLHKNVNEAGCDEAGRGCLAGPVFAATVILPDDFRNSLLDDSKKLSEKKRYELREMIEKDAVAWAVAQVDAEEIDKINILNASFKAMHLAIEKLALKPQHLLIDGNRFNQYKDIPYNCIVKGDGKYLSIAAASVLAKTYRDDYMKKIHKEFPVYHWDKNKGYPTLQHKLAIQKYGLTPYHRKSFNAGIQLKIDFG
jgi:ribonuclease HII